MLGNGCGNKTSAWGCCVRDVDSFSICQTSAASLPGSSSLLTSISRLLQGGVRVPLGQGLHPPSAAGLPAGCGLWEPGPKQALGLTSIPGNLGCLPFEFSWCVARRDFSGI